MKEKKLIFNVVPDFEIVGTSWHLNAVVFCSLNKLLSIFGLSFGQVKVSSLTSKTRYCLALKVDGLPAFTIYDRCSFPYASKRPNETDEIINWHIGTFSNDLAYRTCVCLKSFGLNVDFEFSDIDRELVDLPDLPF